MNIIYKLINLIFHKTPVDVAIVKQEKVQEKVVPLPKYTGDLLEIDYITLDSEYKVGQQIFKVEEDDLIAGFIGSFSGNYIYAQIKKINDALYPVALVDIPRSSIQRGDTVSMSSAHKLYKLPDKDKLVFCTNCKYYSIGNRQSGYIIPKSHNNEIRESTIVLERNFEFSMNNNKSVCFKNIKLYYKDNITPFGSTRNLQYHVDGDLKKCEDKNFDNDCSDFKSPYDQSITE